ncbi:hypothetical protein D3C76_1563860 [compost metagenome]
MTEQIVGDQQDTVLYLGRQVERMPPLGQHLATIVRQVAERGHRAAAALRNRFNALNCVRRDLGQLVLELTERAAELIDGHFHAATLQA